MGPPALLRSFGASRSLTRRRGYRRRLGVPLLWPGQPWYNVARMPPEIPTSAIILARSHVAKRVRRHFERDPSVVVFDAGEALPPLHVVTARAEMMLLVCHLFSESAAGCEFLERFRETNTTAEIRVFTDDASGWPAVLHESVTGPAHVALRAASQPLKRMPSRRVPRTHMPEDAEVLINGEPVRLVNVSPLGAQVLSPVVVKPGQHVSVRFPDEPRRHAIVIWSTFELTAGGDVPRYRAGLAFR